MDTRFCRSATVALALAVTACGGGSSPLAPSTAAPTPVQAPSRSVLTLGVADATFTVTDATTVGRSILKCGDVNALWTVTESAGLPARVTMVDAYLLEADGDIDGRRVSDGLTDRVSSAQPFRFQTHRFACGYVDRDLPMIMKVTVRLTDDAGNAHTLTGETGFVER